MSLRVYMLKYLIHSDRTIWGLGFMTSLKEVSYLGQAFKFPKSWAIPSVSSLSLFKEQDANSQVLRLPCLLSTLMDCNPWSHTSPVKCFLRFLGHCVLWQLSQIHTFYSGSYLTSLNLFPFPELHWQLLRAKTMHVKIARF